MSPRWPLSLPITLGIVMIVLIVALAVGWILLTVFGALADAESAALYWTVLSLGSVSLVLVLVGVVVYLTLSVKAINLSRRQSNFIDSVTHELKSPLSSLKLYLQTLGRRNLEPQQQAEFYRTMLEDVERLDGLIDHLLDAARLDNSRCCRNGRRSAARVVGRSRSQREPALPLAAGYDPPGSIPVAVRAPPPIWRSCFAI